MESLFDIANIKPGYKLHFGGQTFLVIANESDDETGKYMYGLIQSSTGHIKITPKYDAESFEIKLNLFFHDNLVNYINYALANDPSEEILANIMEEVILSIAHGALDPKGLATHFLNMKEKFSI